MMTLILPNCCSGIHRKFILLLLSGAIILTGDLPMRNLFTDASLVGENFNRTLPILADLKDASLLSAYVLIRGHIMFGPEDEAVDLDEDVLRKLQTYLFKVKHRQYSPAGSLLHQALKERDIGCDSLPDDTKPLCKIVMEQCLPAERILDMFPVDIQYFHQAFARLCPLMVFRQRAYICLDESEEMENEDEDKRPILVEPEDDKVWAFGILFVTLSIVVSMGGLILLPFLTRENRRTILTLFEGLAVGGLSGSAILHLFPQAFGISDDDYRKYFWRTFLIFAGIYIFYITERILTLMNANNIKGRRRRSSFLDDDLPLQLLNLQASMTSSPTLNVARRYCGNKDSGGDRGDQLEIFPLTGTTSGLRNGIEGRENELLEAIFQRPLVHTNTPKDQIDQKLATLRNPLTMKMISIQDIGCTTGDAASSDTGLDAETESISRSKQVYVNDIAGMRKDHISTTRNLVDAVAWMIVLGDACLNFIDGLSIGAAFDRNILAGISISVAVMLEEVPHRLGTFSVLIRAGMDMRQAFFWIFISACALYPGLALGAFLGDAAEEESPYIFAIAGGMFLYMALVDVMKEMNRTMENAIRKGIRSSLQILALQNLGIVIAVICLSVLAIYEKEMDFIEVEIRELENQALQ